MTAVYEFKQITDEAKTGDDFLLFKTGDSYIHPVVGYWDGSRFLDSTEDIEVEEPTHFCPIPPLPKS